MLFNNRATFSRVGASPQTPRADRPATQSNLVTLTSSTQSNGHSRDQSKSGFITVTTESITDGGNPISMSDIQVSLTATQFIAARDQAYVAED
jgi:hypothetical protein